MEVICRPLQSGDYAAVKEIIAESFSEHAAENPEALSLYEQEPWYDPDHLLVAEVDGRVVSQMGVRDGSLWFSGVPVPAGLLGTVCTREEYRGKGIGAQMVRFAFEWMAERSLALSSLHTGEERHGFYGRLGYRKAVIEYPRLILNLPQLELSPENVGVRPASIDDASACDEIYAACYGRASGAWSRTVSFWERRLRKAAKLWSPPMNFYVAGEERPLAYLAVSEVKEAGVVYEWGCLPGAEEIAFGLLRQTLKRWQEGGAQVADLALSSSHPLRSLVDFLSPEDKGSRDIIFIRVQDRDIFLPSIRPLLEERASAAGLQVTVRFAEDGGEVTVGDGERLRLELTDGDLAALLYNGYRLPGLRSEGGLTVDPDDSDMLRQLFPDSGACRCALDGY